MNGRHRIKHCENYAQLFRTLCIIAAGAIGERTAVKIGLQVASVLEFLDGHGFHHRDVNPDNLMVRGTGQVMLTDDGVKTDDGELTTTVLDLGVAKDTNGAHTQHGTMVGKYEWMPPEQFGGPTAKIGLPTDLYALGLVLTALATGKPREGSVFTHSPEVDIIFLRATGQFSREFLDALEMLTNADPATRLEGLRLLKEIGQSPAGVGSSPATPVAASAERATARAVASATIFSASTLPDETERILGIIESADVLVGRGRFSITHPPLGRRRLAARGSAYLDLARTIKSLDEQIVMLQRTTKSRGSVLLPELVDEDLNPAKALLRRLADYEIEGRKHSFVNAVATRYLARLKKNAEENPLAAMVLVLLREFAPQVVTREVLASLLIEWKVHRLMDPKFMRTLFDSGNAITRSQVNTGYRLCNTEGAPHFLGGDYSKTRQRYLDFGASDFSHTDLVKAVTDGTIDEVRILLERGATMEWDALEEAVKKNKTNIVELLLKYGYAPDDSHRTQVLDMIPVDTPVEIVRALIMKGYEFGNSNASLFLWPGSVDEAIKNNDKEFALKLLRAIRPGRFGADELYDWAAKRGHTDVVGLLIERGFEEARLVAAIEGGHPEIVRRVIASGRHVSELSSDQLSKTLKTAARFKGTDLLSLLIEDHVHLTGTEGLGALSAALSAGRLKNAQLLIGNGVDVTGEVGALALERAAANNDFEMAEFLMARGVEVTGPAGGLAFVAAASSGYPTRMMELLIERGVDPEAYGTLAAIAAANKGHPEPVRMLLARKIRVDAVPVFQTAVDHDSIEIVKALLAAGADARTYSYPVKEFSSIEMRKAPLVLYAASQHKWKIVILLLEHYRSVDELVGKELFSWVVTNGIDMRGFKDSTFEAIFDFLVELGIKLPEFTGHFIREEAEKRRAAKSKF